MSGAEVAINLEDLMVNTLLRYVSSCVRCVEITVMCFSANYKDMYT